MYYNAGIHRESTSSGVIGEVVLVDIDTLEVKKVSTAKCLGMFLDGTDMLNSGYIWVHKSTYVDGAIELYNSVTIRNCNVNKAYILEETEKSKFKILLYNDTEIKASIEEVEGKELKECFIDDKADRFRGLQNVYAENFRVSGNRIRERLTNWRIKPKESLESLRGKECANGVKIVAVNDEMIRLQTAYSIVSIDCYRQRLKISESSREVVRLAEKRVHGYLNKYFHNLSLQVYKKLDGLYSIDLLGMARKFTEEENRVVLCYNYWGKEIEFIVCYTTLNNDRVYIPTKLSIGKISINDLMERNKDINFKWRFDEKSQEYVIMTLCDVVRIPKDVSLGIKEKIESSAKLENKIIVAYGGSQICTMDSDKALRIDSDRLQEYGSKDGGRYHKIEVLNGTKKIADYSFIIRFKIPKGRIGSPTYYGLTVDLKDKRLDVARGYNIPLVHTRNNQTGKDNYGPYNYVEIMTRNLETLCGLVEGYEFGSVAEFLYKGEKKIRRSKVEWKLKNGNKIITENICREVRANSNVGMILNYITDSSDLEERIVKILHSLIKIEIGVKKESVVIDMVNINRCLTINYLVEEEKGITAEEVAKLVQKAVIKSYINIYIHTLNKLCKAVRKTKPELADISVKEFISANGLRMVHDRIQSGIESFRVDFNGEYVNTWCEGVFSVLYGISANLHARILELLDDTKKEAVMDEIIERQLGGIQNEQAGFRVVK